MKRAAAAGAASRDVGDCVGGAAVMKLKKKASSSTSSTTNRSPKFGGTAGTGAGGAGGLVTSSSGGADSGSGGSGGGSGGGRRSSSSSSCFRWLRLNGRRPLLFVLGFWATMIFLTTTQTEDDTAFAAAVQVASAAARGERGKFFDGVDILGGTARALNLEERRTRVEGIIRWVQHLNATEALNAVKTQGTGGGGATASSSGGDEDEARASASAAAAASTTSAVDIEWYDDPLPKSVTNPADKCVAGCVNGVCQKGRCRCDTGWEGDNCSLSMCARVAPKFQCRHGKCNDQRSCDCEPGYAGPVCAVKCVHGVYRAAPSKVRDAHLPLTLPLLPPPLQFFLFFSYLSSSLLFRTVASSSNEAAAAGGRRQAAGGRCVAP